jgi:hypothetical protein
MKRRNFVKTLASLAAIGDTNAVSAGRFERSNVCTHKVEANDDALATLQATMSAARITYGS